MTPGDGFSRASIIILCGVFIAMVVDGMDLQMLSIALPSLSDELHLSSLRADALGTYTLAGMGVGGILAGRLSDRVGRIRVVCWSVLIFTIARARSDLAAHTGKSPRCVLSLVSASRGCTA
jgi:AAHS family cis,cis-muconate transporter-like MFS transporter